jgi:hypothetical protein
VLALRREVDRLRALVGIEDLREQVEGAGFEVLRTTSPPPNPLMVSRGLMLARGPRT